MTRAALREMVVKAGRSTRLGQNYRKAKRGDVPCLACEWYSQYYRRCGISIGFNKNVYAPVVAKKNTCDAALVRVSR
jgi:hypothetical protein